MTPLGPRIKASDVLADVSTPLDESSLTLVDPLASSMIATLSNKNKRRGFKAVPTALPAKIIFADDAPGTSTSRPASRVEQQLLPRLIPPSELQNIGKLPPRMFVTSVDVEEGMWGKQKHKTNGIYPHKTTSRRGHQEAQMETTLGHDAQNTSMDSDDVPNQEKSAALSTLLDWAGAEQRWPIAPSVGISDNIATGTFVGWMALAINPATFTPEMLLHVARVVKKTDNGFVVRQLSRPDAGSVAFGGAVNEEDVNADDGGEDETCPVEDAVAAGWRILNV
jgi:acetolactate synthase regulatory subunit